MTYWVLGANGFIGKAVLEALGPCYSDITPLVRPHFDVTAPHTYPLGVANGDVIIDTVAAIDGTQDRIYEVNVLGLERWIDFLRERSPSVRYIYFSTTSVLVDTLTHDNAYVRSKREGEAQVTSAFRDHKIVRLTFPFGRGEQPNRLISRLISQIRNGLRLRIDETRLQLTPIGFLKDHLFKIVLERDTPVNFTDGEVYELREVVEFICAKLSLEPEVEFVKGGQNLSIVPDKPFLNRHSVWREIEQML